MLVMPMEISVSCVGDLATVGGSVVVMTPVRSLPPPLFFCEPLGIRKLSPWQFPCALAELSSWTVGDVNRSAKVRRSLYGHMLGGSVSALPVCCLF